MCAECDKIDIPQGDEGPIGPTGPEGPPGPSGLANLTVTDSSTIDMSLTAIEDGYDITSKVKYQYSLLTFKSFDNSEVSYLNHVTTFTNLLSQYSGGNKYNVYTQPNDLVISSGTVNALPDFNKTTGVWTCPSDGYYTMTAYFGYTPNVGFVWLTTTPSFGSVYNYMVNISTNSIWGVSSTPLTPDINTVSAVTVTVGRFEKITAGTQIGLGYCNLSSTNCTGTPPGISGISWNITKVSD